MWPSLQAAPGKLNCSKTEAAQALAALYDRLLTHLRAGGCLVNAVKAEMLMDAESLDLLLTWRVAQAAGPAAAQAVEDAWAEMEVGFVLLVIRMCYVWHARLGAAAVSVQGSARLSSNVTMLASA